VESEYDCTVLWHMRLGHMSEWGMLELHKKNLLKGIKTCKLDFCKFCVLGKQNRVQFKTATHKTEDILDYVHSNVWGLVRTASWGGHMYFVIFIDDFSRKVWVYFMRHKSETCARYGTGVRGYFRDSVQFCTKSVRVCTHRVLGVFLYIYIYISLM
jgi:hypothetical protein